MPRTIGADEVREGRVPGRRGDTVNNETPPASDNLMEQWTRTVNQRSLDHWRERAEAAERELTEVRRQRDRAEQIADERGTALDEAEATLAKVRREWCRECKDEREFGAPGVPADFILWGKLFPPEALGPKCWMHAEKHIGRGMTQIDQWAVYDLRPINAALDGGDDASE